MEERIKDLLYNNPHVSDRTRDFLRSLLHSQKTWGKLTDPQLHALQRIESQNTDDAIAKKEEWRKNNLQNRITHSLVKGIDKYIIEDTEEARYKDKRDLYGMHAPL